MVKGERDFVVFDAKTGDDLTHAVLTQIIVDQESQKRGETLLPIPFLRQLIRFYGASIERFVPSYLQASLETLAKEQERFRKQFAGAFTPAGAFEAYQEQARKNLAMFEQAMLMFSPFGHDQERRRQAGRGGEEAGGGQERPVRGDRRAQGAARHHPVEAREAFRRQQVAVRSTAIGLRSLPSSSLGRVLPQTSISVRSSPTITWPVKSRATSSARIWR